MPNIRLPDGSSKSFPGPVTVAEIASAIGPGLARAALAGKVNGKLVDTGYRVERDAEVAIVTEKDPEANELLRHSTAHLLAHAVKELFPDAQVTIGPVRSEEHTSELQSRSDLVCRLLLEKKKKTHQTAMCAAAAQWRAT